MIVIVCLTFLIETETQFHRAGIFTVYLLPLKLFMLFVILLSIKTVNDTKLKMAIADILMLEFHPQIYIYLFPHLRSAANLFIIPYRRPHEHANEMV